MKDPIERQQTIDALKDWYNGMIISSFRGVEKVIKALPSAEPEQWWIPCYPSDLPKNMELWVTHDNKYYRWVDTVHWDMTTWSDDVSDVVAYMPYIVPKPYKEGDQDETD